jgi:hypothetical protein
MTATIAVTKQGVNVSIPVTLAATAGLEGGVPVRLLFGEEGRRRCVQVVKDPKGHFRLSQRKTVILLTVPELMPKAKFEKKIALLHSDAGDGKITFDLPAGWDLARKELVA